MIRHRLGITLYLLDKLLFNVNILNAQLYFQMQTGVWGIKGIEYMTKCKCSIQLCHYHLIPDLLCWQFIQQKNLW